MIPVENLSIAADLVKLYGVDALFPVSDEKPIQDFIAKFPWLPWPIFDEGLFVKGGGGTVATFLDVYHVVRHLFEDEIKGKRDAAFSATQFAWDVDDPLRDIFLAYLGCYPPKMKSRKTTLISSTRI